MRIGFTGSRNGTTSRQREALLAWLRDHVKDGTTVHHGCCHGADADFVHLVEGLRREAKIIAHPSDLEGMTNAPALFSSHEHHPNKPPLERNRDIVDSSLVLLACPDGPERQRSGTWATIRFARKQGKQIVIIWPDGTITTEGGDR